MRGLILDLRRNGGGSLEEAIHLTGLFIPSGPVVQTRDLSGRIEVGSDDDGEMLYSGPLVVLTSRFSASASEILAGALQDYGRALIVGDSSTFGKGTVQTMLPLGSIMQRSGVTAESDPGALKLTISKFYRPSGNSTQLRGVRPDIVLPSITDNPEISESGMKNPMPWDAVTARSMAHFDLVQPYVATLRDESGARLAGDPEFQWLREDLAVIARNRETKSISLNEAERRREKDENEARSKAHTAARLGRKDVEPTAYEITVKNAATPGLPAPMAPKKLKETAALFTTPSDDEPAMRVSPWRHPKTFNCAKRSTSSRTICNSSTSARRSLASRSRSDSPGFFTPASGPLPPAGKSQTPSPFPACFRPSPSLREHW